MTRAEIATRSIVAFVAVLILSAALPRFLAAAAEVEGERAVERMFDGEELTLPGRERVARSRRDGLRHIARGENHIELALLHVREAHDFADRGDQAHTRASATLGRQAALEGIVLSPGDPLGWHLLAHTSTLLEDGPGAALALDASHATAAHHPQLLVHRVYLGLAVRHDLTPSGRDHLRATLGELLLARPRTLAPILEEAGAWSFARAMLGRDAELRARLDELRAVFTDETRSGALPS